MKTLADGTKVSARSYYFLLDWNDENRKTYISEKFKKEKLCDLDKEEYGVLWLHATTNEYNKVLHSEDEKVEDRVFWLLMTLKGEGMCSHKGDELIEQFLSE